MAAARPSQCATCIFRRDGREVPLAPGRMAEILGYLVRGITHLCHTGGNKWACRGGRDYQLQTWYRLGLIADPTDESLARAMDALGLDPPREPEP
jgi:hypothetical protein